MALAGAMPVLAWGQTTADWLNPVSGSWVDATKWSTSPHYPNNGTPPGAAYIARLAATGSPYTVRLRSPIMLEALQITSSDAELLLDQGGVQTASILLNGHIRSQWGVIDNAAIT